MSTQDDLPLADLEVSPKTASWLQALEASTLAQLLALPSLSGPPRILAELHSLFDELEVSYEGVLLVETPEPTLTATGSVEERWAAIDAWLGQEHPARLREFAPAASAADIAAAEAQLGVTLPEQYTQFLALHDGQEAGAPMVESASLLPLVEVTRRRAILSDLFPQRAAIARDEVDAEVRAVEWSTLWIPIGVSARGRDVMCLDLEPTETGTVGQIIMVVLDDDARLLVANGFADLLSRYFAEAQTGEVDLDDDADDDA